MQKNNNKLIIVCSKNKAKNEVEKNVMMQYFKNFEIKSLETNSNMSENTNI